MRKVFFAIVFTTTILNIAPAPAFEISTLSEGEVVMAGSTVTVKIDPGDIPPLFGVLLMTSRGVVKTRLDSLPPFKWSIEIPANYYGPLTFWAIGRRFYPIPNPPRTSVTILVVSPAIPVSGTLVSGNPSLF
ncbi:MAG: hypothetical protein ACE5F7_05925 [Nitrospiria bacterium]